MLQIEHNAANGMPESGHKTGNQVRLGSATLPESGDQAVNQVRLG